MKFTEKQWERMKLMQQKMFMEFQEVQIFIPESVQAFSKKYVLEENYDKWSNHLQQWKDSDPSQYTLFESHTAIGF